MNNPEVPANDFDDQNNPWTKMAQEADSYDDHIKKMANQKTQPQRALEKVGILESRKNQDSFEEDLKNFDPEKALKWLTYINGSITGEEKTKRRTPGYGVWGGAEINGHLAPAPETQELAIKEAFETMQNLDDNRKRAALAYYTINHLHLFGDGNGRTARVVYEVFKNDSPNVSGDNFMHKTSSWEEMGNREAFEKENNIKSAKIASDTALKFVKQDLIQKNQLPETMNELNSYLDLPEGSRPMPDVYLTKDAQENLDFLEQKTVRHAFFEKPITTLALGMELKKKGRAPFVNHNCIKENNLGEKYVMFEIENKDGYMAEETFKGWDANDYRDYCKIVKDLQLQHVRKLIDIFKNEDQYKTIFGDTYADWLSGSKAGA